MKSYAKMEYEKFIEEFEGNRLCESDFGYEVMLSKSPKNKVDPVEGVDYIVVPCVWEDFRTFRNEIQFSAVTHIGCIPVDFDADVEEWSELGDGLIMEDNYRTVNLHWDTQEVARDYIRTCFEIAD